MADPYLQIRGLGERGGHPDPETRAGSLKKNFSALRASVSSKNKGGGGLQFTECLLLRSSTTKS